MHKNKLGTTKHYIFNTTLRVIVTDTYSKAATDTLAQAQSGSCLHCFRNFQYILPDLGACDQLVIFTTNKWMQSLFRKLV